MRLNTREDIYPLTFCRDRYGGTYSGGRFLAYNMKPYHIPIDPFCDDVTAAFYWKWVRQDGVKIGVGETIEAAWDDLFAKLNKC